MALFWILYNLPPPPVIAMNTRWPWFLRDRYHVTHAPVMMFFQSPPCVKHITRVIFTDL